MRAFGIFFDAGEWRWSFDKGSEVPISIQNSALSGQKTFWALGILLALLPIAIAGLKLFAVI